MSHQGEIESRFTLGGKKLLTDLTVIGALGACQTWGLSLLRTGSPFAGSCSRRWLW